MTRAAHPAAISHHRDGPVAHVRIGTGQRRNALRTEDWAELERVFNSMAGQADLRLVVLRGTGDTFCAGSDIREWANATQRRVDASFSQMEASLQAVERLPAPVLAVVQGVAAGAGCQLALACDLQVFASSAHIGMPIARLGILISPAFTARLVAHAGPALTRDLLYTGRLLNAEDSATAGMATRVLADTELDEKLANLIATLVTQPPVAIRAAKAAVRAALAPLWNTPPSAEAGPAVDIDAFVLGVRDFLTRHGVSPSL